MSDKAGLSARISRELGIPVVEPSRGGTITRPFLEAMAEALGVGTKGLDKVQLARALVLRLGQEWDASCSSAHTGSGGGGNITAVALQRMLTGIQSGGTRATAETPRLAWDSMFAPVSEQLEIEGHLDVSSLEDERWRVFSAIVQRRGQSAFRDKVMAAYRGRCAFTGCDVPDALEAAHVVPYLGSRTNLVTNGLLLRADVHTLFDLALIGIDPESRRLVLAETLRGSAYDELHDRAVAEPTDSSARLTHAVLLWRAENIGVRA